MDNGLLANDGREVKMAYLAIHDTTARLRQLRQTQQTWVYLT